jgi:hypothetical protein
MNPVTPYTSADLAAVIPEIWAPMMNEPNFPKAILSNFVVNLSQYMDQGGDVCHVPDIYTNKFSISTQTVQGTVVTTQTVASVDKILTVNNHKYIAWIIGDKDLKQIFAKYDLQSKYVKEARSLLITELEKSLFSLWTSLTNPVIGNPAGPIQDIDIRKAISALESASFDMGECAFFLHTAVYWEMASGIAKYYAKYASDLDTIRTGNFGKMGKDNGYKGRLYDHQVFTSPLVSVAGGIYKSLFLHSSAFGFAIQTNNAQGQGESYTNDAPDNTGSNNSGFIRSQMEYVLSNLGTLCVVDMIYGVAALRPDAGVVIESQVGAVVL